MENLKIDASKFIPGIYLNAETGILEIAGNSGAFAVEEYERSSAHWVVALGWVEQYIPNPQPRTTFLCKLRSFDTTTSKYLVEIFKALETIEKPNTVEIFWQLGKDDSDILDYVENVNEMLKNIHITVVE